MQFLIKKKDKTISAVFFLLLFGHQNPGSGLDLDPDSLEMLDPGPYPGPDSMNSDPQLCLCENTY